jgi:hypothetical protein
MATINRVQTLRSSTKGQRPAGGSREPGELYVNFPDRQIGVVNVSGSPEDLVPVRFFSTATDYVAGDYVFQAGNVWRARTTILAGAFNSAQWDKGASTPADLLAALVTVDGAGSALDADLLDGQQGAFYAPVASPAFTGTPTAPTPAPGTSTTQIATTAFVTAVDALKANLADPVFTGDPRAPTPAAADNDTSIATTAYVTSGIATATAPAALMGKILTVDGAGSSLDADFLDGQNGAFYTTLANQTGTLSDAQHGTLGGGALHAQATSSTAGFMLDAPADNVSYGRKNNSWATMVGGATISDTAPVSGLLPGQLWFESDSGNTFIWYDDGTSQQWVQQNVMPTTAPAVVPTAQTCNRIVNGAMQHSQENGDSIISVGGYICDQWNYGFVGPAVSAARVSSVVTPNGSLTTINLNITTPKPSLAAGDYVNVQQPVEGTRVADFGWGMAAAKQAVLRFTIMCGVAGTYAASVKNSAVDRTWLGSFTIAAGEVGTYVTRTLVIPGDVTGTWLKTTGIGMYVGFGLAAGTTFQGVAGWQAGNKVSIAGNANAASLAGAHIQIADVGLYLDPDNTGVAPKWQTPDYASELAACQRYWQKAGAAWGGDVVSGRGYIAPLYYMPMRTAPTATGVSTFNSAFPATAGTISNGPGNAMSWENRIANLTQSAAFTTTWSLNARM